MNWNLTVIFKNNEEFLKELASVQEMVQKVSQYEGHLSDAKAFKEYFNLQKEFEERASKLYLYAHLQSDLNKKDVDNAALLQKCMVVFQQFGQATSFETPEILALGKEKVMEFISSDEELKPFKFIFEKTFHEADHTLSKIEENLMAKVSPAMSKGGELYSMLAVADGVNEKVELEGKEVTVTQGNWADLIDEYKNEDDQRKIFEAIFKKYEKNKNTYAAIYDAILEADKARMKARGYDSILDVHLHPNNIPTSVYETLVDVASNNNEDLHKYIKLREKYLGLSKYRTYHRFLSLAKSNKKYEYEDAKELFFKSIEKFPDDFKEKARTALEDGYVDVLEKEGKRTGAYSSSVTNFHPFILLNYNNTLDNVFTVAHEAGHSIHSLYAMEAQPSVLQNYTIFVAEIASTFNEHNLLDYLISSGKLSKDEQILLLQKAIDSIISTFYRQTLFAEYELRASRLKEQDVPLNYMVLSNIMVELYKKYYGLDIKEEVYKEFIWAYIPHLFYTPFYVYQYATSFSASLKLYQNVKENKPNAFEKYIGLLAAGGSKYPTEIAKDAGIDFEARETFEAVTLRMKELVAKLEKLLEE